MEDKNNFNSKSLSHEDTLKYIEKYQQENDQEALDILVKHNQGLVNKHALYYAKKFTTLEKDDLSQEGNLGLIRAIKGFDLTKGVKFPTYATPCIKTSMIKFIYRKELIDLPDNTTMLLLKLKKTRGKLTQELSSYPTNKDIAKELGISLKKIEHLQYVEHTYLNLISLDKALLDNENHITLKDFIPGKENIEFEFENQHYRNLLENYMCVSKLTEREKATIRKSYYSMIGKTLEEIGKSMNPPITKQRVFDIHKNALKKLGDNIDFISEEQINTDKIKTNKNYTKILVNHNQITNILPTMTIEEIFGIIKNLPKKEQKLVFARFGSDLSGLPKRVLTNEEFELLGEVLEKIKNNNSNSHVKCKKY